mmetsp:Transcript_14413/g.38320  ORF Transcript_14413/g.38320 Transcript_14413/m.38320 type:complete len:237 (+) Transcript_14413:486-1196(+)
MARKTSARHGCCCPTVATRQNASSMDVGSGMWWKPLCSRRPRRSWRSPSLTMQPWSLGCHHIGDQGAEVPEPFTPRPLWHAGVRRCRQQITCKVSACARAGPSSATPAATTAMRRGSAACRPAIGPIRPRGSAKGRKGTTKAPPRVATFAWFIRDTCRIAPSRHARRASSAFGATCHIDLEGFECAGCDACLLMNLVPDISVPVRLWSTRQQSHGGRVLSHELVHCDAQGAQLRSC